MDAVTAISNIFSAFGLSSAAGLNAYIPLLAVGLLNRFEYISLQQPFDLLGSTPVLAILILLGVIDFIADKIPAVDHATHVIGALISPVAGAIVFASQNNIISDIHPALALGAGFIMAGGFHATRSAIRPVSTATTAGFGNPVLSFMEDVTSLALSVLAFVAPLIAFLLFLVLLFVIYRAWRSVRRRTSAIRR
jgi:hypothetical protein